MLAPWRHLANMTELVLPLAHPSTQPKWQIDRFSCFFTAHGRKKVPKLNNGRPFPSILPLLMGHLDPNLIHDSLTHNRNGITIGSTVFAQVTTVSLYITMGRPFLPQNCPFQWGDLDPIYRWFPGPTQVLNPNGISIGSAIFARLTSVRD